MATFAPDVPNVQIPDFQRSSQPISQPEANKSMAYLFKGIGDVLDQAVTDTDKFVKSIADNSLEKKVQPIQEAYVKGLQKVGDNIKNTGGRTLLSYSTDNQVPRDVDESIRQAELLSSAKANGNLSETAYLGKLYAILKDTRSSFPGYTDYIDKKMSSITGRDVANDYLKSMIGDINSANTNAKEEREKISSQIRSLVDKGASNPVTGYNAAQLYQEFTSGSINANEVQKRIIGMTSRHFDYERKKEDYEAGEIDNKLTGKQIETLSNDLANNSLTTILEAKTAGSGHLSPKQIFDKIGSGEHITPEMASQFQLDIAHAEGTYRAQVQAAFRSSKTKDGRSYYEAMGDAKAKEIENYGAQHFAVIKDLLSNQNYGAAHEYAREIQNIQNKDMIDLYRGEGGHELRLAHALKEASAPPEVLKNLIDHFIPGAEKAVNSFLSIKSKEAVTGTPQPNGRQSTLTDSLDQADQFKTSTPDVKARSFTDLINNVNRIADPTVPDNMKVNLVKWAYGSQNLGLISKFEKMNDQKSIFSQMTSDSILREVKRLSDQGHPELWNNVKDWARQSFGRELFFNDLQNFNKLQETSGGLKGGIAWNDTEGSFHSDDKTAFVQNTLKRINEGLYTISNIARIEGKDKEGVNAYMLSTLQELRALHPNEMVTGLPQAMYDAVRKQKEAQKALEEEQAARMRRRSPKDQDKVYGGSR